jgi:hypothetical protein
MAALMSSTYGYLASNGGVEERRGRYREGESLVQPLISAKPKRHAAHLEADVVHTARLVSLKKSGNGAVLAIRVQQLQQG